MSNQERLIFQYGWEGGGSSVFLLPDLRVAERGSSGGMLDEDEDPEISWDKEYEHWEAWWQQFREKNQAYWIHLFPNYIHPDIRLHIRREVDAFLLDEDVAAEWKEEETERLLRHKSNWYEALDNQES